MIYFDNAATTKYKPNEVYDAVNFYLKEVGVSPGRGSYSIGIEASRMLYVARKTVGKYFGLSRPERTIFTKNSTEAINVFFTGYLKEGDHVIISCYEHNAVLRPLHRLAELGVISYSVIKREDLELAPELLFERYANDHTRLLAVTLASNLTGRIIFREEVFRFFKQRNVTTFLDASQGAGKLRLIMRDQAVDFLAFTGHKDLLAIPGVGGLCCESTEYFSPLIQGGTGLHGESYINPDIFPEGYEAGTLNMPAIWSLKAGIDFINENENDIQKKENDLLIYLVKKLKEIKNVIIYDIEYHRVPTVSINMRGIPSDKLVSLLDKKEICVRGGIHCAILAHQSIGTDSIGTVRISLSYRNTKEEIDKLIFVLQESERNAYYFF